MKSIATSLLLIIFSMSIQAQTWNPEISKALQAYYSVPVEFDYFGEWIAAIRNDSTLQFQTNQLFESDDSISLKLVFTDPSAPNPFTDSRHTIWIYANTITSRALSIEKSAPSTLAFNILPPQRITQIQIVSIFTFADSLPNSNIHQADEAWAFLSKEFKPLFASRRRTKNVKKTFTSLTGEKMMLKENIRYLGKNEVLSRFGISRLSGSATQEIQLRLSYQLNHSSN